MTTRARIVEFLERNGLSTSEEIGRSLQIPLANARHHLRSLLDEGATVVVEQAVIKGRGRPARLYGLSKQVKSHNLDVLASAALQVFLVNVPPGGYQQGLQEVANRISPPLGSTQSTNLTGRLTRTIRRLNELNYQARWEAHREAPHLILGHCPYAAILAEHPELCQIDALVIQNLLGATARQMKKLARDSRGSRYCLFNIEPAKKNHQPATL
jgi:predicted ArsR family transcriptional regulator